MIPLPKRALTLVVLVLSIAVGAVGTWQLHLAPEVSKFFAANTEPCNALLETANRDRYDECVKELGGDDNSCGSGFQPGENGGCVPEDGTDCTADGGYSGIYDGGICYSLDPDLQSDCGSGFQPGENGGCVPENGTDCTTQDGDSGAYDGGICYALDPDLSDCYDGQQPGVGDCGSQNTNTNPNSNQNPNQNQNPNSNPDYSGNFPSSDTDVDNGGTSGSGGSGSGSPSCVPTYQSCSGDDIFQHYTNCNGQVVERCSAGCDPRNAKNAECRPSGGGTTNTPSSGDRHLECVNRTCSMVGGDGADQCARPIGSACGGSSSTGGSGTGTSGSGGGGGAPSAPGPTAGAVNHSPIGSTDGYSAVANGILPANSVFGWAEDPDTSTKSIDVHVYFDGVPGCTNGCIGVAVNANLARPDVNTALGISGNHGWAVVVPEKYRDGKPHAANAYGIDSSGDGSKNSFLGAKNFTPAVPTVTATVAPTATTSPASGTPKPGDVDRDGDVDIFDLNVMVTQFGSIGYVAADLNGSGKVDIFDYNILVANFGK